MNNTLYRKLLPYLLLNVVLIYFFTAVVSYLGLSIDKDIAFSTPDSNKYFEVGKWIFDCTPTEHLTHRPFLFPLILYSLVTFLGIKAYFLFQLCCWLLSANLLFAASRRMFKNTTISVIAVIILVSNLSFLMFTFHALTEVVVIFLLTLLIYLLSCCIDSKQKDKIVLFMFFVMVLLSVIKPIFYYFTAFLSALVAMFYLTNKKRMIKKAKNIGYALVLSIPLIIQLTIMKTNFNTFRVSTIGSITFKGYLFQRCYAIENNLSRQDALNAIEDMGYSEQLDYAAEHKKSFIKAYCLNMQENIKAYSPPYLEYKKDKTTGSIVYEGKAKTYMEIMNIIYFYLHLVFLFAVLFLVLRIFYKKEFTSKNVVFLILAFVFYGFMFTSAISYDEGDRLVLPALPLWILLYMMTVIKIKKEVLAKH